MPTTQPFLYIEVSSLVVIAATLTGILCGSLSPYLVWKRLGLLSDSVSHAALMVIAVALAFGVSSSALLIPFSVLIGLLLSYMQKKDFKELDSVLGIFFAGFMGVGLIVMHVTGKGSEEVLHALFGDIQSINAESIAILVTLTILVVGYLLKNRRALQLSLVQPDLAKVEGIPVNRHMTILLVLCSVTVAVCLQLMGIVLITMLFVAPSMTALSFARSTRQHLILSVVFGVGIALLGTAVAQIAKLPVSASIATVGLVVFAVSVVLKKRN
jgi:zinc transport system permease protein